MTDIVARVAAGNAASELAVVFLAFLGVAEDGVRFGDLDEAVGCGWVGGVVVWVVGFG